MESLSEQRPCRIGDQIFGSDGEKIGKVEAVSDTYLTVEKGFIFKEELYIPTSAINNCLEGEVYLTVTKDEALHQGWDVPPPLATEADGRPLSPP